MRQFKIRKFLTCKCSHIIGSHEKGPNGERLGSCNFSGCHCPMFARKTRKFRG